MLRAMLTKRSSIRTATTILASIRLLGPRVTAAAFGRGLRILYSAVQLIIRPSVRWSLDAAPKASTSINDWAPGGSEAPRLLRSLSDYIAKVGQPTHLAFSQGEQDVGNLSTEQWVGSVAGNARQRPQPRLRVHDLDIRSKLFVMSARRPILLMKR